MESFNCLDLLQLANTQSSSQILNDVAPQNSIFAAEKAAEMNDGPQFVAETLNIESKA